MGKKYTLYNANTQPEGEKPPCAFFASSEGCRNGDNCRFAHVLPEATHKAADTGSVVSSESEDGEPPQKTDAVSMSYSSLVDAPIPVPAPNEQQPVKKKNRRGKSTDDPFAHPKAKKAKTTPVESPPPTNQIKQKKKKAEPIPAFKTLNLPVASFSVMPSTAPKSVEKTTPAPAKTTEKTVASGLPQPLGHYWSAAVQQTRSHPKFQTSSDFDRYKQQDEAAGYGSNVWVKSKPFDSSFEHNPTAIAIDCEMCETQDPVSGQKDPRALCRISVVNAATGETLLDSLVKPSWSVTDHRARINGIEAQHLQDVQFTLRHAQAFMLAVCCEQTVIVGHAVHNDLAALRLEHSTTVDSANLYEAEDRPTATVSLKDTVKTILGKTMPDKHDSVNDAKMALDICKHWVDKKGQVAKVVRSHRNSMGGGSRDNQLFVHRISKRVEREHLHNMFASFTSIEPEEVQDLEFSSGDLGKTHVVFRSAAHAALAFDTLEGKAEKEASGRLQKKVYLKDGSYLRVRKMAFEKDGDKKANSPRRMSTS